MTTTGSKEDFPLLSGWSESQERQEQYQSRAIASRTSSSSVYDKLADDIQRFASIVGRFQRYTDDIGTARDTSAFRRDLSNDREGAHTLSKQIMEVFKVLPKKDDKLMHERLMSQFKEVCLEYESACKISLRREREYRAQSTPAASYTAPNLMDAAVAQMEDQSHYLQLPKEQQQQQQMQEQEDELTKAIVAERNKEILNLENDIKELSELMNDIAENVYAQQEMVDNIEANVSHTDYTVEAGVDQLRQANEYQKKARKRMCYIFLCVIVLLAILFAVLGGFGLFTN